MTKPSESGDFAALAAQARAVRDAADRRARWQHLAARLAALLTEAEALREYTPAASTERATYTEIAAHGLHAARMAALALTQED